MQSMNVRLVSKIHIFEKTLIYFMHLFLNIDIFLLFYKIFAVYINQIFIFIMLDNNGEKRKEITRYFIDFILTFLSLSLDFF